ncbi:MAG: translation initiation factor IF-3 [Clostridiales bacterium]|nr:translation initiation factor IF-3 [Clostridiales bacterium]
MKELLINDQITGTEVRLVGEDGEQLGIMSLESALEIAKNKDLDLVQISPNAVPSVCKVMDYGKYRFDQIKREKEARKKNKAQETKIIQLSLTIGDHDMNYRVKNAKNFLTEGSKVKVNILLKGRQQAYPEQGIEIMKKFASLVGESCNLEKAPSLEGKFINMVLSPKK